MLHRSNSFMLDFKIHHESKYTALNLPFILKTSSQCINRGSRKCLNSCDGDI